MFSFFTKNNYLADQLYGFVDIHNHILPAIDDGAQNLDESIAIIKGFAEFGVKNFVCTPHIIHGYHDNTPKKIKTSYNKLKSALKKFHMEDAILDYAAEHMIDGHFETILQEKMVMPLRKHHLLIEMSFMQKPFNFDTALEKIKSSGYFPILAHPERYTFFHKHFGKYQFMKKNDIYFQVNLLSLAGYYGNDIKNVAFKFIDMGMVDFLASDIHNPYQIKFIKECTLPNRIAKKVNRLIDNTIEVFW